MNTEFETVVTGGYVDNNGNEVAGVYATIDDSKVLVDGLGGTGSPVEMSFEEAKKKYGDRIIDEYLGAHGMLNEFGERCLNPNFTPTRRENQRKATQANIKKSEYNKALIIHAVLEGVTKQDIEYSLGFCRNTINKAVNSLTQQDFDRIWRIYKDTVFADLDWRVSKEFINYGCDYKRWMAHLSAKHDIAFRKAVNSAIAEQMALKKVQEQRMSAGAATLDSIAELFELEL